MTRVLTKNHHHHHHPD
ncbi:his operon leader peptide [uncultured Cedecea sp.]|nr:his operon leader peptide [uncultured Cedecea sp.]